MLGATHVVQVFSWHDIQPSPARWEWEYTDWLVRAADHYDLEIIARLDKPPPWAVDDATALSAPPRRREDYAEFARRVAERYRGQRGGIHYLERAEPCHRMGKRTP